MISSNIFFISFILYSLSLFFYILGISREDKAYRAGYKISLISFLIHTTGLLIRYYEAGIVELKAYEESSHTIATGIEKFKIMLSHPPFTNLYESMVFVLWGVTIVYLILNKKYSMNIIGLLGSGLVVIGMGLSNLLPDKSISPLIPALKSWWLHLHVITASLSYGAFLIAAIVAMLYLIKDNIELYKILSVFLFTITILILMMVSFNPFDYSATLIGISENGKSVPATITLMLENETQPINITLKEPAPLIGIIAFITIILSFLSGIILTVKRKNEYTFAFVISASLLIYLLSLLFSIKTSIIGGDKMELAKVINYSISIQGINPQNIVNMNINIMPPYRITLNSYPYQFSIILMLFLISIFLIYLSYKIDAFRERLPSSDKLDTISYRTILFAFPMMTFVILTGAVWAHFAWGRYWGWDPKETWSLITWLVYAFYLHSRHILKWSKERSAIIAVIGFAVVIFTYIGVNLGLTGSGLHVYGSR